MKTAAWIDQRLDSAGRAGDEAIDLAPTALALAALDHPETDIAPYLDHLDALAYALGLALKDHDAEIALAKVIAEAAGYAGDRDTYDDPANADLMRVIDRRRGLPVALGILYLDLSARVDLRLSGLAFPGHFLVRLEGSAERRILDPFNGGAVIDMAGLRALLKSILGEAAELAPDDWAAASARDVLIRLLNNQRSRALKAGNVERAFTLIARLTRIAPSRPELWRDQGVMAAELGLLAAAQQAFETALALIPDPILVRDVEARLRVLKRSLN